MPTTAATPDPSHAVVGEEGNVLPSANARRRGTVVAKLLARAASLCVVGAAVIWLVGIGFDARRLDAGMFLQPLANRLLNGEGYGPDLLVAVDEELSVLLKDPICDFQIRQDLTLVRVVLLEAAFQGDDVDLAERRLAAAEEAARLSLVCSPNSPIPWTVLAWAEYIRHDDTPLLRAYLDMSHRTGPFNGWSLMRRMEMQLRLYPSLNDAEKAQLREALDWIILKQATNAVAELYLSGAPAQRAYLRDVLADAPEREQKRAADYIRVNGQDIDLPLVEPMGSRPWK